MQWIILWQVLDFQHVKPGKGAAFVRSKLRNLRTGSVQEKTFRAGEKVEKAHIENRRMQYLYASGESHVFMDNGTYEQIELGEKQIERELKFLKENMEVSIMTYQGEVLGVELPNTVELQVTETEPGIKGDTASNVTKPATLETGSLLYKYQSSLTKAKHLSSTLVKVNTFLVHSRKALVIITSAFFIENRANNK